MQHLEHPFSNLFLTKEQWKELLAEYLAMSIAFPYLQAGASSKKIFQAINNNEEIDHEFELTSVVASFLVWDEFGGWLSTKNKGNKGLLEILNTKKFHANILRDDLKMIFGSEIKPHFGNHTKNYLIKLYDKLSHQDDLVRLAAMTSFESHAENMITALWQSLYSSLGVEKERLKYFFGHVGGSDPAEAYHVSMTEQLVDLVVKNKKDQYEELFIQNYNLHKGWCSDLTKGVC